MRKSEKSYDFMFRLVNDGIYFTKDADSLSVNDISLLMDAAKRYKYKPRPNNSSYSSIIHIRFYLFMQSVYQCFESNNCYSDNANMADAAKHYVNGKMNDWYEKVGRL